MGDSVVRLGGRWRTRREGGGGCGSEWGAVRGGARDVAAPVPAGLEVGPWAARGQGLTLVLSLQLEKLPLPAEGGTAWGPQPEAAEAADCMRPSVDRRSCKRAEAWATGTLTWQMQKEREAPPQGLEDHAVTSVLS